MTKQSFKNFLAGFISAIAIICLSLFIGSKIAYHKWDDTNIPSPTIEVTTLDTIKLLVIEEGDSAAFHKLIKEYRQKKNFNFYPYARIMADRYRYAPANYFVYCSLMDRDSLDSYLKEIALDYLKKAIEYGDTAAILELKNLKNK